jgi:HD superfamily phosphodiesterase
MKRDSTIAKAAKAHVRDYLDNHLDGRFEFHNLEHTETVVKAVNAICQETGIDEHGRRILQVAAWFHDVGYTDRMERQLYTFSFIKRLFFIGKSSEYTNCF